MKIRERRLSYLFSLTAGVAVTASLFSTQPTVAQDASTYYTVRHPEQFKTDWAGFYRQADAATAEVRSVTRHTLDLAYGSDVKQRLDLYFPATATSASPVFLFFHGGGFREGDRAQYGFIAKSFTAHGIIAAIASYRLTGAGFIYPAQRAESNHRHADFQSARAYGPSVAPTNPPATSVLNMEPSACSFKGFQPEPSGSK
jgi:acetyl esterase/lipase